MRVLYFHQHFTTTSGSGGTRSYELARALIRRGHEVTMVCGCNDRSKLELPWIEKHARFQGKLDGIEVIALPLAYSNHDSLLKRAWVFLRFAWRSALLALRLNYDLIFATSTPLTAGIPGIAAKVFRRKKFVFEVRDLWPELPRALGMKNPILLGGMSLLEWMSYRAADACVGLAPGIVQGIRRRSRSGQKIVMIPNACDLELFAPTQRSNLRLPGIKEGDFVALFTGAHGFANGLGALLEVASELKNRGRKDIKLVFIGDGKEKAELVSRAHKQELDNCLFFDLVKKRELAKIVGSADAGLMVLADVPAFYFGTSPNKFFDYISAGLPVIINYPGWIAELIERHQCGIAVPPSNPKSFAEALCRLADQPDWRRCLGIKARGLAEAEFGRERLANRFVDFLESVSSD